MTISADYQMEFNSLLLGAGTSYTILDVSGLADYPEVLTSDHNRLRRHGLLPGDDFLGGRTILVTLNVRGAGSAATLTSLMDALRAALPVGEPEGELSFQFPGVASGQTALINARPRRMSSTIDHLWSVPASPTVVVEFFATNPRYLGTSGSASTDLPTTSGGLTFSVTFSATFGSVGGGGAITATNSGTYSTPPSFRLTGPLTGPRIYHEEQGRYLYFDTDVATGDYLDVDADSRTILLNGTANRYSALASGSTWFDLDAGDNTIQFSADTNTAGTLQVSWRDAWI